MASSKKENFIEFVKELMNEAEFESWDEDSVKEWSDALDYWNALQMSGDGGKPKFTENGKLVLAYLQQNKDAYNNLFKAKEVGEGLSISSRTVSGAMRKLVTDGFVEKIGEQPVVYALTQAGFEIDLSAE